MPMIIQAPKTMKRAPVDLYPRMQWPDYEFTQFPEWVTAPEGWAPTGAEELERGAGDRPVMPYRVLVHDEDEKARVLDGGAVKSDVVDEKTALQATAARKGIAWDNRWSLDTARQKVGA